MAFRLFDCVEFHSEYQALEVIRHTPLTDKMSLHYFELPKLPETVSADDGLQLWLKLFAAETEEELQQIEALEVSLMRQAIEAYRSITATDEFRTLERMRSDARRNEAAALSNARNEERSKWERVVAERESVIAERESAIADKDAENARLRLQLADLQLKLSEK